MSTIENADVYHRAVDEAIREFRDVVKVLTEKQKRFAKLRSAIVLLSNELGRVVPPDVLAACDKRQNDVRRAVERSKDAEALRERPAE